MIIIFFILSIFLFVIPIHAAPPIDNVGYDNTVTCGFDMNRNGIIGEAADCNVCDGVTADPDGDGTDEDINYVDSVTGVNDVNCGAAGDPCATIAYVLAGSNSSYSKKVDGPGDGAEDIICFAGTITGDAHTLTQNGYSGVTSGYYDRDSDGWRYPNNPLMIVGWDKDNDGQYPPVDTDDTAVLDGNDVAGCTFLNTNSDYSYLEFAHFTVIDYDDGSFQYFCGHGGSYIYHHDIRFTDIHRGLTNGSSTILFSIFTNDYHYLTIENTISTDMGGYWMRGSCSDDGVNPCDHLRVKNNTATMFGSSASGADFIKIWGVWDDIEILNNLVDGQSSSWYNNGAAMVGIVIAQCIQNATIRGNKILNFRDSFQIQAAASGFCTVRSTQDILFDQNIFSIGDSNIQFSRPFIIQGGDCVTTYSTNYQISNNWVIANCGGGVCAETCVLDEGCAPSGYRRIVGNSFVGNFSETNNEGCIALENNTNTTVVIENNIIDGSAARNIRMDNAAASFTSNGNVFENLDYHYNGTTYTSLGTWQSGTNQDANSAECAPSFVSTAHDGDLHLSGDSCATDQGVDITAITTVDIDGDIRASSNDEAGADAESTSAPSPLFLGVTLQGVGFQ